MKPKSVRTVLTTSFAVALSAGGVAMIAAAPASAQTTVDELTVTGRYGPGAEPRSLSQAVSYADLDLSLASDRDELKHRISLTARYLCEKLGESDTTSGVTPSCRDQAQRDAMAQARPVIRAFKRDARWAAGPAWAAPYPSTWERTYPDTPYE